MINVALQYFSAVVIVTYYTVVKINDFLNPLFIVLATKLPRGKNGFTEICKHLDDSTKLLSQIQI